MRGGESRAQGRALQPDLYFEWRQKMPDRKGKVKVDRIVKRFSLGCKYGLGERGSVVCHIPNNNSLVRDSLLFDVFVSNFVFFIVCNLT
jgi:hypothetical protein